ncbi:hypothetical protein BKA66DRAFT_59407 [Pyrenochaeta sp. MPI-SDFR-AT-0127]|nr:hypothetical protein BKA66DRAFT_59407 [Pyrenochaeta sp. MPI-SDFR-AT-0127]
MQVRLLFLSSVLQCRDQRCRQSTATKNHTLRPAPKPPVLLPCKRALKGGRRERTWKRPNLPQVPIGRSRWHKREKWNRLNKQVSDTSKKRRIARIDWRMLARLDVAIGAASCATKVFFQEDKSSLNPPLPLLAIAYSRRPAINVMASPQPPWTCHCCPGLTGLELRGTVRSASQTWAIGMCSSDCRPSAYGSGSGREAAHSTPNPRASTCTRHTGAPGQR